MIWQDIQKTYLIKHDIYIVLNNVLHWTAGTARLQNAMNAAVFQWCIFKNSLQMLLLGPSSVVWSKETVFFFFFFCVLKNVYFELNAT